jgi:3-hydroxyisobutyrate dehydrogenase-like beta-hydroxyacid dehydrogenase
MTMSIAFLGLGQMGSGMAANLVRAGHDVTVWNRSPAAAAPLKELGAKVATDPAAAVGSADLVMTMLANDEAVASVTLGERGFIAALPQGALHVSMSTISVALAKRLTERHQAHGQRFVSAPVFGRPDAAAAAKLFVAVAGDPADIATLQPALDAISQRTFVIGTEPSQATLVKLAGNFLITCVIESLAEAYTLAEKAGIEPKLLHDMLTETLFAAPIYKVYGSMILAGQYTPPGFAMALGQKDNRLIQQAAEALEVPLPMAGLIRDRFLAALANGGQSLDWSAFAKRAAADAGLHRD